MDFLTILTKKYVQSLSKKKISKNLAIFGAIAMTKNFTISL